LAVSEYFAKGDKIRLRVLGSGAEWCAGTVALVSGNGKSVGIELQGAVMLGHSGTSNLGMITGALPLIVDEKAGTCKGLMGEEYEVQIAGVALVLYEITCPGCRMEWSLDDEKLAEWKAFDPEMKCVQCARPLKDEPVTEKIYR
jgi:hypothetical protein